MPTTTTNYGLTKPDINQTGWGTSLNTNFDVIDTQIKLAADAASSGSTVAPQLIASASTLAFDFVSTSSKSKVITLSSSVTSSSAINMVDGLEATFLIKITGTGLGFVFPSNFVNATAISTANANNTLNNVLQQKWRYDSASSKWYQTTPLMY